MGKSSWVGTSQLAIKPGHQESLGMFSLRLWKSLENILFMNVPDPQLSPQSRIKWCRLSFICFSIVVMKVLPREPDPPCYECRWVPEEGLVCMLDCWALPHLPHRPLGQSFSRGKPFKRRVYRTTSMSRIEFIPQSPTPELGSCKYDHPSIFWRRLWFLAFLGTQEVCLNSSHQALSYTLL